MYVNVCVRVCVQVFGEGFGASFLGETWVAASPTLEGPWVNAVKVLCLLVVCLVRVP